MPDSDDSNNQGQKTYYDILHVQPSAPLPIIKNAYRALMHNMKLHPDLGGDDDQAALINLAYETLRNESKRAAYDRSIKQSSDPMRAKDSQQQKSANETQPERPSSAQQNNNRRNNQYAEYAKETGVRCPFCYQFQSAPPHQHMDCRGCGSPLDPILQGLDSESATRSIARINKNTAVRIQASLGKRPIKAQLQDLSPHGVGFTSQANLNLQQVVKINCADFGGLAIIVHRRDGSNGDIFFGAQFVSLRFTHQSGNFISTSL